MVNRRRERGQLVLIAALLVATSILGAVVLLNAVHSSPDVKAQTDAQGLVSAERAVDGTQEDLRELFRGTTPQDDTQYLFAEDVGVLGKNVTAYSNARARLAATEGAAISSVELDTAASRNGSFVAGDIPNSGSSIIEGAESVPYLFVNATSPEVEVTIARSGVSNRTITLKPDAEYVGRSGTARTCTGLVEPITLELRQGTGEIRGADGGLCEISVYDPSEASAYDVSVEATSGDGRFAVSGVTPTSTQSGFEVAKPGVVVNPAFNITYHDPSVSYDGQFTLFGGESR